jgi:hypothetical protein
VGSTIVFAALAVTHSIEHQTGWRIKKFVRTARRYRTIHIHAGRQTLTAVDPLPDDLHQAIAKSASAVRTKLARVGNESDSFGTRHYRQSATPNPLPGQDPLPG